MRGLATQLCVHARAVFGVCLASTKSFHDAEDVAQAVFLKAIGKTDSLRDPEKARAWLLQVARRECIDFHRRRKTMNRLVEEPSAPAPTGNAMAERLHAAIHRLPQDYREPIVLYYLDGRSTARVAASLGATEAAIRQRLVRARAMLHDLLREERS